MSDAGSAARTGPGSEPRSAAEWVTFGVSAAVLLVVAGLIAVQFARPDEPAAPVARVAGAVREVGDRHYVDVEVTNEGNDTAADVQVAVELVVDGKSTEAEQVVDFLAGDETEDLVFIFEDDPAKGELTVEVTSFRVP